MLRFNAFIRSKTFPPLGRGLCAIVFPALLIDKVNKRALVMVFEFIPLKMRRLVHNVLRKIEAAGAMVKLRNTQENPDPTTSMIFLFRPPATWSLATLLPSASCSLTHTVSASARIEPAQPFRVSRYMLSISMNYFIARGTGH
jgi:hypothetical protein